MRLRGISESFADGQPDSGLGMQNRGMQDVGMQGDLENQPDTDKLSKQQIKQELDSNSSLDQKSGQETVSDALRQQEETEKQLHDQQRDLMKPQLDKLDQSFSSLNQGMLQGQTAANASGDTFNNLNKQMTGVQSLIKSLEKSVL